MEEELAGSFLKIKNPNGRYLLPTITTYEFGYHGVIGLCCKCISELFTKKKKKGYRRGILIRGKKKNRHFEFGLYRRGG